MNENHDPSNGRFTSGGTQRVMSRYAQKVAKQTGAKVYTSSTPSPNMGTRVFIDVEGNEATQNRVANAVQGYGRKMARSGAKVYSSQTQSPNMGQRHFIDIEENDIYGNYGTKGKVMSTVSVQSMERRSQGLERSSKIKMVKDIAMSSATPEHKEAAINALMKTSSAPYLKQAKKQRTYLKKMGLDEDVNPADRRKKR